MLLVWKRYRLSTVSLWSSHGKQKYLLCVFHHCSHIKNRNSASTLSHKRIWSPNFIFLTYCNGCGKQSLGKGELIGLGFFVMHVALSIFLHFKIVWCKMYMHLRVIWSPFYFNPFKVKLILGSVGSLILWLLYSQTWSSTNSERKWRLFPLTSSRMRTWSSILYLLEEALQPLDQFATGDADSLCRQASSLEAVSILER